MNGGFREPRRLPETGLNSKRSRQNAFVHRLNSPAFSSDLNLHLSRLLHHHGFRTDSAEPEVLQAAGTAPGRWCGWVLVGKVKNKNSPLTKIMKRLAAARISAVIYHDVIPQGVTRRLCNPAPVLTARYLYSLNIKSKKMDKRLPGLLHKNCDIPCMRK